MGSHTVNIDFHGLDKDIEDVISKYPDETASFMRKSANKWKKDANTNGYGKYTGGKKPIPKSWKTEKEENILHQATSIQVKNTARHFHLVENGHVKWIRGRNTGGFVPGKHYAEKTREEWREKFPDLVDDFVDNMLKGHGL